MYSVKYILVVVVLLFVSVGAYGNSKYFTKYKKGVVTISTVESSIDDSQDVTKLKLKKGQVFKLFRDCYTVSGKFLLNKSYYTTVYSLPEGEKLFTVKHNLKEAETKIDSKTEKEPKKENMGGAREKLSLFMPTPIFFPSLVVRSDESYYMFIYDEVIVVKDGEESGRVAVAPFKKSQVLKDGLVVCIEQEHLVLFDLKKQEVIKTVQGQFSTVRFGEFRNQLYILEIKDDSAYTSCYDSRLELMSQEDLKNRKLFLGVEAGKLFYWDYSSKTVKVKDIETGQTISIPDVSRVTRAKLGSKGGSIYLKVDSGLYKIDQNFKLEAEKIELDISSDEYRSIFKVNN